MSEMQPYYILSSGTLKRNENTILIERKNGERKAIPVEDVDSIHVFGQVNLNKEFLVFLARENKPLHIYNYYGNYSGTFLPRDKNVSGELLVRQVEHYLNPQRRFFLALAFVEGAMFHAKRNLREYSGTELFVAKIEEEFGRACATETIAGLMGCEGRAKEAYYQAFNLFLKEDFSFEKREKHPPSNPVNALISFGNSLLYTTILSECYRTQLNPTISYLHEPRERRFSLCLDLSEIFKPLVVDPIIFRLINTGVITTDDFDQDLNGCYLNDEGRKEFLKTFDQKLKTTFKHRRLRRKVSYRTLLRLECYKLIRHLLGDEVYAPFKAWW